MISCSNSNSCSMSISDPAPLDPKSDSKPLMSGNMLLGSCCRPRASPTPWLGSNESCTGIPSAQPEPGPLPTLVATPGQTKCTLDFSFCSAKCLRQLSKSGKKYAHSRPPRGPALRLLSPIGDHSTSCLPNKAAHSGLPAELSLHHFEHCWWKAVHPTAGSQSTSNSDPNESKKWCKNCAAVGKV